MYNIGDRVMIKDLSLSPFSLLRAGDTGKIRTTNHKSKLTGRGFSTIILDKNGTIRSVYDDGLMRI